MSKQDIVVIDYNAGNIQSVLFALERIGVHAKLTSNPDIISSADKVIFPGVGEASSTMNYLKKTGLGDVVKSLQQPVFAICIGQQLLCDYSEEGDTNCLGVIPASVLKFTQKDDIRIPHMGWNQINKLEGPLFEGVPDDSFVYFVHSYYTEVNPFTTAVTEYSVPFSAAMQKDNFYSCQFHPEKSADIGEIILRNFIGLSA